METEKKLDNVNIKSIRKKNTPMLRRKIVYSADRLTTKKHTFVQIGESWTRIKQGVPFTTTTHLHYTT